MGFDHYAAAVLKQDFDHEYSPHSVVVTISIALAYYNSLEMILLMSSTFKRYTGLYFWSLACCNLGVFLYTLGIMLSYFELCVLWLNLVILDIGWLTMLTCQSLVLYSRLGLLLSNANVLAAVKWMIIFDSAVLGSIVIALNLGNVYSGTVSFAKGYYYIEQIQLIWFTVQELILSGLYIWSTRAWLKVALEANTRTMVWQLLIINVIIIAMDLGLVTLQFVHYQLYQEATKAFVYSVKLKLELNILSKLVDLVQGKSVQRSMTLDIIDASSVLGRADIQKELASKSPFRNSVAYENKNAMEKTSTNVEYRSSPSISPSSLEDGGDKIDRVTSTQSRFGTRVSGRDSDIMYADMLRDMT